MKLIITEKKSVAHSIAAVLDVNNCQDGFLNSDDYIISWCAGHLLELAKPVIYDEKYSKWQYEDLPITPVEWRHTALKGKKEQLNILCDLMNRADVDLIINACDAGREGELIFRLVYEHAKCTKPILRQWLSSMEEAAIRDSFDNLKDGAEYENLYAAASCRERADWYVGLNITRLLSVLYNSTLNTGRVLSPTLAMLTERENEILNFIKTPFYTVELDCGGFNAVSERFDNKETAENTAANCQRAVVTSIKEKEKSVSPPKLYDLTALQREANRIYGYTAQQTLDYTQILYEKGFSTYPRTNGRYLTDDMAATVTSLVAAFAPDAPCHAEQVLNSSRVKDHFAIIPTEKAADSDFSALPSGEQNVLNMIITRLVCAVGEKHRYIEKVVTLNVNGTEFKSTAKTIISNGWKDFEKSTDCDDTTTADGESAMPELSYNQLLENLTATVKEGATTPPAYYTEDTLLLAMENADTTGVPEDAERKGLGTPATRAGIIEKLIKIGFVERSKRNLLPTEKGINLVTVLPPALTSAKLTAEWEYKLKQIENGELDSGKFMSEIEEFVKTIVIDNNTPKAECISLFPKDRENAGAPVGTCPRCGSLICEWKSGFFCDTQTCEFKIWRNNRFWTAKRKPLTAEIVAALLKDGQVKLKGLYSEKSRKLYDATVVLDDTGDGYVNFELRFDKR